MYKIYTLFESVIKTLILCMSIQGENTCKIHVKRLT